MMKRKSSGRKINIRISPKQILLFWIACLGILMTYFLIWFGTEPIEINLLDEYWLLQGKKRFINKNPIYIMSQSFVLPDKSSSLLALGGILVQLPLAWIRMSQISPNPLTRLVWIISLIAMLPLGFTLFFDICLLIAFLIIFAGPLVIVVFLFRWILRGKWN